MKTWIASYIYQGADGAAHQSMVKIDAVDYDSAYAKAAAAPPAEEFLLTVAEETADQFLGQVRHSAAKLTDTSDFDPTLYAEHEDLLEALEALIRSAKPGEPDQSR